MEPEDVVYVIGCADRKIPLVKIGHTRDLVSRLAQHNIGSPTELVCLATYPGGRGREAQLHQALAKRNQRGEWFDLGSDPVALIEATIALLPDLPVKLKPEPKPMDVTPFEPEHEDDSGQSYPWGPQDGETAMGFQAFATYRDMSPGKRTIAAVGRQLGRDATVLRALSAKFNWVDRAFAFDAWLDKRAVEDLARGRTQMRQEHADAAVLARTKIMARLKTMSPDELSVRDLAAWLDLAVKLERQARGEADRKIEVSGEINVIEGMPADERRTLMAEAMKVLGDRLGVNDRPAEIEAYMDAEVIDEREEAAR